MANNDNPQKYAALIIGAGASGLIYAIHAARKGLKILVLEKNQKAGMEILVSGSQGSFIVPKVVIA